MLVFPIMSQYVDGTGSWNPALWKIKIMLFYIFDTKAAGDLVMQRAKSSATKVLV